MLFPGTSLRFPNRNRNVKLIQEQTKMDGIPMGLSTMRFTSIWEIINDLVLQELFKGNDGVTFTGLKVWGPNGRYPNVSCG